jgi:hypothetical protein
VKASDACGRLDGGTLQCNPSPGLFPVGTTEVVCSVADTFGHVGRCAFNVTVLPPGTDLIIEPNRTYMVLRWSDAKAVLQCAPRVTGPWSSMTGASSPYTVSPLEGE